MPDLSTHAVDPEHIAVSRSAGIKIDWKDGHHSEYELQYLRDHCPCASCAGAHGQAPEQSQPPNPLALYKPKLKMQGVEPVGGYALRIQWSDGHSTGIYTFDYFRRICRCPDCRSEWLTEPRQ